MSAAIIQIQPGTIADDWGLVAGDRLLSVNGKEISDALDYTFHAAPGLLELVFQRGAGGRLKKTLVLEDGEQLGLVLDDFRAKACNNKCVFCFVDQLPKGVRRTLRFKDDDFRLSFLHGNYVTLTNLRPAEMDRIIEQRLSPLYVSVHATELKVRAIMLGRPEDHCRLDPLWRLIDSGIQVHAQVVLCPGINDGIHLEKTILELSERHPGLISVAIVPLGTSRFRGNLSSLREVSPDYCSQVIDAMHPFQAHFRRRLGVTFAYLADEFYLQAGRPLPGVGYYDDFELLEDGVGMVRHFEKEFRRLMRRRWKRPPEDIDGTLVTGRLFYPLLEKHAAELEQSWGARLRVVPVRNDFLGEKITVAGLLGGRDIAAALTGKELGRFVVLPGECLARDVPRFLDDLTLEALQERLDVPVRQSYRTVEGMLCALLNQPYRGVVPRHNVHEALAGG